MGMKAVDHQYEGNIFATAGAQLSVERLSSMKKYVFGLGSAQLGLFAIVIGNGLALSSTAVVLQVLQEQDQSQLKLEEANQLLFGLAAEAYKSAIGDRGMRRDCLRVAIEDPGIEPVERHWPSIDLGTEIYMSDNQTAEWTVSDFDIIIPGDDK
ncbi:hypothetical protein LOK49_LG07G02996 [Camellia lanceoleosa]|uniref:Uncharacterized protein n=1 Tax=Camellia lanceoleosa TaxID=1840588 RepID=A0ACC0H4K9_9ERIC|nr:hypothetical protein LOK49_LG07G02996 [Camellia lanceoleosa]